MRDHFRQALEDLDIPLVRKLWAHVMPNMPQPDTERKALHAAHYARTLMPIEFTLRAYSHSWLLDNGFPSGLPDELRPRAQRIYPVAVGVVGIACIGTSEIGRAVAPQIQKAMSNAVLEAYADGHAKQPHIVKARMMEGRRYAVQKLLGKKD